MTVLAPILEAFFTDRLITQRGASPHTIAPYRESVSAARVSAGSTVPGSRASIGWAATKSGRRSRTFGGWSLAKGSGRSSSADHHRKNCWSARYWLLA